MIIEFSTENFRSFRELVTFSLVAAKLTSKNRDLDKTNVCEIGRNPALLTSAAIYGANASGKSNLVGAIGFMRQFVLDSTKETRPIGAIDVEPFRLSNTTIDQPSLFEIVIIIDEQRYRYGFEVTSERVVQEWLYVVPTQREALLFERTGDEIKLGEKFKKEGRDLIDKTRPNALFLSVVAQFNGATAQSIVSWFRRCGFASGNQDIDVRLYTMEQLKEDEVIEGIVELVKRLDLGIVGLRLEKGPVKLPELPDDMPEDLRKALTLLTSVQDNEQVEIKTVHTIFDEGGIPVDTIEFDLDDDESDGTQKLFALAGPIMSALAKGQLLIVDELDSRLHPLLTREIVKLFNDPVTNPNHAQLIFTTQDTNLLDNDLFRRDQIWFVEKDSMGASQLYSLAEFRIRNDKSYERGYIQGRFGAIPYIGNLQELAEERYGEKTKA